MPEVGIVLTLNDKLSSAFGSDAGNVFSGALGGIGSGAMLGTMLFGPVPQESIALSAPCGGRKIRPPGGGRERIGLPRKDKHNKKRKDDHRKRKEKAELEKFFESSLYSSHFR